MLIFRTRETANLEGSSAFVEEGPRFQIESVARISTECGNRVGIVCPYVVRSISLAGDTLRVDSESAGSAVAMAPMQSNFWEQIKSSLASRISPQDFQNWVMRTAFAALDGKTL